MSKHGWIGVDLDGTLAYHDGRLSADPVDRNRIGRPIPAMVARVKKWLAEGREVRIVTARAANNPQDIPYINVWCEEHLGQALRVTCSKDMYMVELWDDRAVQVVSNTGLTITEYLLKARDEYDARYTNQADGASDARD